MDIKPKIRLSLQDQSQNTTKILVFTLWSPLLLFAFINIFITTHFASGQCPDDQKSLLLELLSSLEFNHTASTKLVWWNQSSDCCQWNGLECDRSNGQVIGLDLSNEGITGGIDSSSSLFRIRSLQSLSLAYNLDIYGTIPSVVGNLSSLTYLNLSNTGLDGQVPIEISQLVNLLILDISASYFSMESPNLATIIQNLTNVRELYLDGVSISAIGKQWCQTLSSSLPHLQVLSMSYCSLEGEIHQSLAKLRSISVIRLDGNNFRAPIPQFLARFTNLTTLTLSDCQLAGVVPREIFQVPALTTLDLSGNFKLQGTLPDFPLNASLQTLVLRGTQFSGLLPHSMGNLKRLRKIDLSYCDFIGVLPSSISSINKLEYVDLSNNSFWGPIPSFSFNKLEYVDLSSNNFWGPIPSFSFNKLEYVDLSYNNFWGPIPSFSSAKNLAYLYLNNNGFNSSITSTNWGALLNLASLDLSKNSLSGSIPASLFSVPSLTKIDLSQNKFSGQLNEFGGMHSSMLQTLKLRSNNLEGPIPKSIFHLRGLGTLDLSENKFNGTLGMNEIFHAFKDLWSLDLSHNCLTVETNGTSAAANSRFPELQELSLASCNLGVVPEFIRTQEYLIVLDLSDNHIQGLVPRWLWNNGGVPFLNLSCNNFTDLERPLLYSPCLAVLDIHANNFRGEIPHIPSPKGSIEYLDWSNNGLTSINPDFGNNLSSARFLSLARNDIHGRIPTSICNATSLVVLNLGDNHFKGTIPGCLVGKTRTLVVLNLRGNNLSGAIPNEFGTNFTFETLDFSGNILQGPIPTSIANCKELRVLDIGHNQLDDTFPCKLESLSKLQVLILRSNKFSGTVACPGKNSIWPILQILDLASNHFSGELTAQFIGMRMAMTAGSNILKSKLEYLQYSTSENDVFYQDTVAVTLKGNEWMLQKILKIFTSIDLSNNSFHGKIPRELGNLNALIVLNLSHNSLSGNIPSSFGNLSQLESLDLSCNALGGNIPPELAKLNFLQYLNLSYNKLAGPIPTGTQLQSFDVSSYQGNPGLYGPPLTPSSRGGHDPRSAAPSSEGSKWGSRSEVEWMLRGAEVGFPVGLTIFIGPLLYIKRWRRWYCKHLGKFVMKFLLRKDNGRGRRGKRARRASRRQPRQRS